MKKLHSVQRCKQDGFTLIELLIGLAVVFGLGVIVLGLGGKVFASKDAKVLKDAALEISSTVMGWGSGTGFGTASLNSNLINAEKVPSSISVSGTTLTHNLGGTTNITGRGRFYVVTFADLNKAQCLDFVNGLDGFKRVIVNTSATPPANVTTGGAVPPINMVTAGTLCTKATGNVVHLVN
jgi:prepilin-type N-terminal cleavage/methylation domain-containing protein